MVKEMNKSTKIDPVTYYEDYEDDDCASSEELKAAFDRLFTTPEEILKLISENVDECEDELPSFSSFYQGTVKPYTQNKRMEAFINASKMEC